MKMFINFSNHPSSKWSPEQLEAASEFGAVRDFPFPQIPPEADEGVLEEMVNEYVEKLVELIGERQATFHIMGEMNFSFLLVRRLQSLGYDCVASTSARMVEEIVPGQKTVIFRFVRFRRYSRIL